MLGVRRTTVTSVAKELQARGIIRYGRGQLEILDRAAMQGVRMLCGGGKPFRPPLAGSRLIARTQKDPHAVCQHEGPIGI